MLLFCIPLALIVTQHWNKHSPNISNSHMLELPNSFLQLFKTIQMHSFNTLSLTTGSHQNKWLCHKHCFKTIVPFEELYNKYIMGSLFIDRQCWTKSTSTLITIAASLHHYLLRIYAPVQSKPSLETVQNYSFT